MNKTIENLQYFYGIGPGVAKSMYDRMIKAGIITKNKSYSVSRLRGKLSQLHELHELPTSTLFDITYNPMRRIPRRYISALEAALITNKYKIAIGGSYSRGKQYSGDIDIVFCSESPEHDYRLFEKQFNSTNNEFNIITPGYASGKHKTSTFIKYKSHYMKADIFFTTPEHYIFMLMFAIGSGKFNMRMRAIAKRKGLLLNQYGLFKNDKPLPINSETDIFKALSIKYLEPRERNI